MELELVMPELVSDFIKKLYEKKGHTTIAHFQIQFLYHLDSDPATNSKRFMKKFHKLKSNNERVNLVYEKLKQYDLVNDKFILDVKSDAKATHYKEKGNKWFGTGNYRKALNCYTKALMHARSEELIAIAYANRSAVLFKFALFEECVTDIDRAMAHNYPERLKSKIVTRRAKSLQMQRKARTTFRAYEEPPVIPTNQKNPVVHCASNCVEIKYDEKSRKRVFASRDIQIGEVIAVEAPFCATIGDAKLYHCHDCFELCYNPMPCDNCTQTLYCSETCKNNAYNKAHKDECPILLSLKELVGRHQAFLLGIKMAFLNKDEQADEVLRLSENMDSKNICDEQLRTAITAGLMYDLVKKHTERFRGPNCEHAERVFKDLLLTYLRICIVQAAGIDELCPDEDGDRDNYTQETIACAIYPVYGLFRHSCCPNVFAHHHGLKRVLRAIRRIRKGQECFVSFGPHYIEHSKEDRQGRLSAQYHFNCKCRACREDWPQIDASLYSMASQEDMIFMVEIGSSNVDCAKRSVPKKIQQLKRLEQFEPRADLTFQQKMLLHCYDVLGNKRVVV